MDSELDESIKDLIRKVMYYVINFEIETGQNFPDMGWYEVNYAPEFFVWVSNLENQGIDTQMIQDKINRVMKMHRSKNLKKLQEDIQVLREKVDFYKRYAQYDQDYVMLEVELKELEKMENSWLKEVEKIRKNVEDIIEKLIPKTGHDPMKVIESMIGSSLGKEYGINIVEFDDYKVAPTYTESLEQQFLSHIPNLAMRGINFEQFVSNPEVDLEAYDLFARIPDPYKERIRSAFLTVDQANQQLLELVPSFHARGITVKDFMSNPNIDPYAYWLFQFIKNDRKRVNIFLGEIDKWWWHR